MDSGDVPRSLRAKEFVIEFIEYRLDERMVASTLSGQAPECAPCTLLGPVIRALVGQTRPPKYRAVSMG